MDMGPSLVAVTIVGLFVFFTNPVSSFLYLAGYSFFAIATSVTTTSL